MSSKQDIPGFNDHFSDRSGGYASFRPVYPAELFDYLAAHCELSECAWDCATGNGQAARSLSTHFRRVIATDASTNQIAAAELDTGIDYRVAKAEQSGIETSSVDLITIAQALHWFDLERFYTEAKRVLKPRGLIAVWCYDLFLSSKEIDAVINYFYSDILGGYWPPERRHIEAHYHDLPFPFTLLHEANFSSDPFPEFYMRADWDIEQVIGYLSTWSAVTHYQKDNNSNPLKIIEPALRKAWGNGKQLLNWRLYLIAGISSQHT